MVDLIVPIAKLIPVVGNVPLALRGQVNGAVRSHQALEEMAYAMGRGAKPRLPILLYGPDDRVLTVIMTDGETEVAELEDLGHAVLEKQAARVRRGGRAFDFDQARERAGMARREEVGAMMADALRRRIAAHRANPVTDPARVPAHD